MISFQEVVRLTAYCGHFDVDDLKILRAVNKRTLAAVDRALPDALAAHYLPVDKADCSQLTVVQSEITVADCGCSVERITHRPVSRQFWLELKKPAVVPSKSTKRSRNQPTTVIGRAKKKYRMLSCALPWLSHEESEMMNTICRYCDNCADLCT